jgi:hypothetical protein
VSLAISKKKLFLRDVAYETNKEIFESLCGGGSCCDDAVADPVAAIVGTTHRQFLA